MSSCRKKKKKLNKENRECCNSRLELETGRDVDLGGAGFKTYTWYYWSSGEDEGDRLRS